MLKMSSVRAIALGCAVSIVSLSASAQDSAQVAEIKKIAGEMKPFSLRVLGMPTGTSEWGFLDKPFWNETIKELSGGKVTAQLSSMSELNLQGGDVFKTVAQGMFDVADTVANYGAGEVMQLDAPDLAGVAGTFEEQRKMLDAYRPVLADAVKERFGLELLGITPSTAQTFFCKPEVRKLSDLQGKKVRTSSASVADLLTGLGAVPVTMAFAEAIPAMQRGVVDCIVTGTMSANTAKVPEVADYIYPLTVGWAPRVRVASRQLWAKLDEKQRNWLQKVTDYYIREISDVTEARNTEQGILCSTGDEGCKFDGQYGVKKAKMTITKVSDEDKKALREVVEAKVLPAFAKACGDKCAARWQETVGAAMNLKMTK
jgi:TRAP-type C4-dicarboxylate transport system substrate-binding protein